MSKGGKEQDLLQQQQQQQQQQQDQQQQQQQHDSHRREKEEVDTEEGQNKEKEPSKRTKLIKDFIVVTPREFNTLVQSQDTITKSSAKSIIAGEVFFYQHTPQDIQHLFPKVYEIVAHPTLESHSIQLEKIVGTTFSHLSVSQTLTNERLLRLLESLHQIHCSGGDPASALPLGSFDLYANYALKVRSRFHEFKDVYERIATQTTAAAASSGLTTVQDTFLTLVTHLERYKKRSAAVYSHVVHGDPVFSNIIYTPDDQVVFIDMRGSVGSVLTIQGDLNYDLAKVFQSLWGYDFIILDKPIAPQDNELLESLRSVFLCFIQQHYKIQLYDLYILTASLFFSLIPLHDRQDHHPLFFEKAKELLSHAWVINGGDDMNEMK